MLTGENYKISVLGSENNKIINYFKCKNFPHPTGNSVFKEKSKFISKFGSLNSEKATVAKSQSINKEILSNTSNI